MGYLVQLYTMYMYQGLVDVIVYMYIRVRRACVECVVQLLRVCVCVSVRVCVHTHTPPSLYT